VARLGSESTACRRCGRKGWGGMEDAEMVKKGWGEAAAAVDGWSGMVAMLPPAACSGWGYYLNH
jgi:hypothetical protein